MFFVRQRSNQCGLHAIQNMFKSAAISNEDMAAACSEIHEETGDAIFNHESFGGDWSVSAVLAAIVRKGYQVERGVDTKNERVWSIPSIGELLLDSEFRGMIIHQPLTRHFTCLRPENVDGLRRLFFVDSQSEGPIRISPKLATRRCLSNAYAWEPFVVKGPEMEYVAPVQIAPISSPPLRKRKRRPPEDFMKAWYATPSTKKTSELPSIPSNPRNKVPTESVGGDK